VHNGQQKPNLRRKKEGLLQEVMGLEVATESVRADTHSKSMEGVSYKS